MSFEKPHVESPAAAATSSEVESPQPMSAKPSVTQPIVTKPALPKKPDLQADAAGKSKRMSGERTFTDTLSCPKVDNASPLW